MAYLLLVLLSRPDGQYIAMYGNASLGIWERSPDTTCCGYLASLSPGVLPSTLE